MDRTDPGERLLLNPVLLAIFFHDALDERTLARFVRQERAKREQRLANFEQVAAEMEQAGLPLQHVLRFATRLKGPPRVAGFAAVEVAR